MTTYRVPLPKNLRPHLLASNDFLLKVQKLEDTEKDYATVMASKEHLRNWCGDTWPEDTFTVEENREDLAGHIDEAEKGFSYGYTVWSPDGKEVLGSVYLYPAAFFADRYDLPEDKGNRMREAGVAIDYWLKPDLESSADHGRFIDEVQNWLETEWGYTATVWPSRPGMVTRRNRYEELGMSSLGKAESLHTSGWFQHYHIWRG